MNPVREAAAFDDVGAHQNVEIDVAPEDAPASRIPMLRGELRRRLNGELGPGRTEFMSTVINATKEKVLPAATLLDREMEGVVAERDMTDEERKNFESQELHHDQGPEPTGPASESDQGRERSQPVKPQVLPNPD
jgi:hypothetical protein